MTLDIDGAAIALENLLMVLDTLEDYQLIFTFPNADTNGRELISKLTNFQLMRDKKVFLARSLGQVRYLSLMKGCTAVIGNSSSGLIEAPTFKVPTVNVGSRQKGRIAGDTVITCGESIESIKAAISTALSPEFRSSIERSANPYGEGNASERIVEKLISHDLNGIIRKIFHDIFLRIHFSI